MTVWWHGARALDSRASKESRKQPTSEVHDEDVDSPAAAYVQLQVLMDLASCQPQTTSTRTETAALSAGKPEEARAALCCMGWDSTN